MENKGLKLEDVFDLLTGGNYEYYMHGTGRAGDGNQAEVIASIFKHGLRTYKGRLYLTSEFFGDGAEVKETWDSVKHKMDNWEHIGSKHIVIVRLPKEFINQKADEITGEREEACCVEVDEGNDEPTLYINPIFVLGCYHAETGTITMNPNFKKELSPEIRAQLKKKYDKALKDFDEKNKKILEQISGRCGGKNKIPDPDPENKVEGPFTLDNTDKFFGEE